MASRPTLASLAITTRVRPAGSLRDAGIALVVAAAIYVLHGVLGFPTLHDAAGDNDSLLRLVEVHDLIGGQGWFDLHQYRMGPDGGFVMHWSRLVDAPLAIIILAATAITGSASTGDMVALVLWPMLLMALALFFIMRATRRLAGDGALFPAVVIGAVSLRFMGIFNPGSIDHHNVQLVLALATVSFLLDAARDNAKSFLAGTCTAFMLAVGMETAPYVAVAGTAVAAWYLVEGEKAARIAAGFGVALGLTSAVVFFATVPAGGWLAAQCDAFSVPQFALAACAGFGLAGLSLSKACGRTPARRLASLAILGTAVALVARVFFPQCLGDPYAGVDPQLRRYWLDAVTEAQPLWKILANNPGMAATYYATPLLALTVIALRIRGQGARRAELIVAGFLAAAFLVSIWQVRGAMFSVPFAVLPLAAWVAERRAAASGKVALSATLKMLLAWLVSFSVTWTAAAAGISTVFETAPTAVAGAAAAPTRTKCQRPEDYDALAALPAARVLASSNIGSPILRYSAHHVLAGPYHRNNAGNLLALHALMRPQGEAEAIVRSQNVTLVALCPGNDESDALAEWAPGGLMADLMKGNVPPWLEPVASSQDQPLVLYRVRAN